VKRTQATESVTAHIRHMNRNGLCAGLRQHGEGPTTGICLLHLTRCRECHRKHCVDLRGLFPGDFMIKEGSTACQRRSRKLPRLSLSLTAQRFHYTLGELSGGYSPKLAIGAICTANKAKIVACKGLGILAQIPRDGANLLHSRRRSSTRNCS
jgi:hypothetical protein